MPTFEVMTVSRRAPLSVLDSVMTAAEQSLQAEQACRVWVEANGSGVTVMAEFAEDPRSNPRPSPR